MTNDHTRATTLVVRATIAPLHGEARVSSPMVSQRLAGHVLEVMEWSGDWARVRGADAYEGWVHRGYVQAIEPSMAVGAFPHARMSLGCTVRARGDDASPTHALPLGAWIDAGDIVVHGECVSHDALAYRFPRDADAIARTAVERFTGTPYLWGGTTPWGADCSGLVQTVFALHGVTTPRDAWQQAECGVSVEDGIAGARPADLLFFSDRDDRRISHVGIALGAQRMVHLGLGRGGYAVERLDDPYDAYTAKLRERFVAARRLPELARVS